MRFRFAWLVGLENLSAFRSCLFIDRRQHRSRNCCSYRMTGQLQSQRMQLSEGATGAGSLPMIASRTAERRRGRSAYARFSTGRMYFSLMDRAFSVRWP